MFKPVPATPSPAAAPLEGDLKREREVKLLDEETVKGLISDTFEVVLPDKGKQTKKCEAVVQELFVSDNEFREVARQVISKTAEKFTPGMSEKEKKKLAAADLVVLINKRYVIKKRLETELAPRVQQGPGVDPAHVAHATHLKARIKAAEIFSEALPYDTVEFSGETPGKGYIAHRNEKGGIDVYSVEGQVGKGGRGTVSKVKHVVTAALAAYKVSKPLTDAEKKQRAQRFTASADRIKVAGEVALFVGKQTLGQLMPLHEADMVTVIESARYSAYASQKDRQKYVRQVIHQQFDLQEKGLMNLDLKLQNIMLSFETDKKERVASAKLIDLDDILDLTVTKGKEVDPAKVFDLIKGIQTGGQVICSTAMTSPEDYNAHVAFRHQAKALFPTEEKALQEDIAKDVQKYLNFLQRFQQAIEQQMIFTLGSTCFILFTGRMPYTLEPMSRGADGRLKQARGDETVRGRFPWIEPGRTDSNGQRLLRLGYSEKVVTFIRSMMDPDPTKRPTKDQVKKAFADFKFLSKEEIEKLEGSNPGLVQSLKDEAEALKLQASGVTLEKLAEELQDLHGKYRSKDPSRAVQRDEYTVRIAAIKKKKDLLTRLPEIQKRNRQFTDFNPYVT